MRSTLLLALLLAFVPAAASAQLGGKQAQKANAEVTKQAQKQVGGVADSALEAKVKLVASQLRCPICQGLSLEDSPSSLAQEMRGVIRQKLAAGETPAQVKAYFVNKYSEWILLQPEAHGFNLAVYLLPLAAVLVGVGIIWRSVRRWSRKDGPGDGSAGDGEPAESPAATTVER